MTEGSRVKTDNGIGTITYIEFIHNRQRCEVLIGDLYYWYWGDELEVID